AKGRLRWGAVRSHAILDGHAAPLVLAQRRVNHPVFRGHMAMNNGVILLLHGAAFPNPAQFKGRVIPFGHKRNATGLTIQAIDKLWSHALPEIKPDAADEAGHRVAFGWMTYQARWFVYHQKSSVLVDHVE